MRKWSIRLRPAYLVVLVILVAASFLAGTSSRNKPIHAQEPIAPNGAAAPDEYIYLEGGCTIGAVWTDPTVVMVYCSPGVGAINYFAYPDATAADSRQANRYLAILNTAFALNKKVYLYYNPDSAANPAGCSASNCRGAWGMQIAP